MINNDRSARSPESTQATERAAVRMRIARLESQLRGARRMHAQLRDRAAEARLEAELSDARSKLVRIGGAS